MQIPNAQTKKLTQTNTSNILGELWATFNIDLTENEGNIRLGKRLIINTGTADVAEITSYPAAFSVLGTTKYAVAGASGTGYVFSNSTPYPSVASFAKIVASGSPATVDSEYSDMMVSNNSLYVSTKSNSVYRFDGSSWTTFTVGASDAAYAHMLTSYAGRTYMSKLGSSIQSWDSSDTVATLGNANTLQLSNTDSNIITFLRSSSNRIWIGVVNKLGGKGYIYEWDGAALQVTKSYRLESAGALACVIKDDVPYVIDANGALLVWNGGTFKKIAQFNRRRNRLLWNPLSQTNNRFIHPNGMSIVNGKINILIDGRNYDATANSASVEETIASGIWEYDEAKGLYHKHAFGLSKAGATIKDYGGARIAGAGALAELNIADTASGRDGTFLAGATYYTDATTTTSAIFYNNSIDTEQKAGYLVTTKIRPEATKIGPTLTATWQKLFITFRKLLASTDRIVVKYRAVEQEPTTMTITWASTTSFTTTDSNMANYAVGDEVEVISAIGSGMCSHITAISVNAGTYTVTVDETHTGATGTAKARFQKWIKIAEVSSDQTSTWKEAGFPTANGMPLSSTWIQIKIWMLFTGQDELEYLIAQDIPARTAH